jgi:phosphoenolpyruvate carboxykinase (ATP)
LVPKNTWEDKEKFDEVKQKLIGLFQNNFKAFEASVNAKIISAGPKNEV